MEWSNIVLLILIVSLLFLVIPIRIDRQNDEPSEEPAKDVKLFQAYVIGYKKPYRHDPDEYHKRFSKFQKSLKKIEELNNQRQSNLSARYGLTKYSDMTEEEFLSSHLRPDLPIRSKKHQQCLYHHNHASDRGKRSVVESLQLPAKFDWRDKGVVTAVKMQGLCGACWAFSTVEVAETMFALSNGTLTKFSVQEMIDCAKNSNFGCEGGDICSLLEWLVSTKTRIVPEVKYPLTRKTDACKIQKASLKAQTGIRISSFTCDSYVKAEEKLLKTIVTKGPVAVAVNALTWQNYLGGIIQYHCNGSFESLNHAVEIVGYDKTGPTPFYIVRNSWGPNFGDKGYLYIAIGSNICGLANQVSTLDVIY